MNLARPLHHNVNDTISTFVCVGELQPVEVEVPVLVEDDEEEPVPVASSSKGKRKAPE
jgi:hypothetical protein